MTESTETAFDTAEKTLTVTITGRRPDGRLTYTTSPASIEFHARRAKRVLKCRIGRDSIPGTFVFTGYGYAVADVQVDARGGGTPELELAFQFNGQKIEGDLIFQILDETGKLTHGSDVDPQVGNDPDPRANAGTGATLVLADNLANGNGANDGNAAIATTLKILTYPDGSYKGFTYSNLDHGAFEFPKGTVNGTLNVTLTVDRPQYAGRYYIYEYFSTRVQPVSDPEPGESGTFEYGTTSVVFGFTFSSTQRDQTYFSINVFDTGTDPGNIYDCDPQVGNDPDPKT